MGIKVGDPELTFLGNAQIIQRGALNTRMQMAS
jgi:hypothetical protein